MKHAGYCVQVFVKTADATVQSDWTTTPAQDNGEYVFATSEEAEKYAKDKYGETRQWRVVPFKMDTDETET